MDVLMDEWRDGQMDRCKGFCEKVKMPFLQKHYLLVMCQTAAFLER